MKELNEFPLEVISKNATALSDHQPVSIGIPVSKAIIDSAVADVLRTSGDEATHFVVDRVAYCILQRFEDIIGAVIINKTETVLFNPYDWLLTPGQIHSQIRASIQEKHPQ